MSQESEAQVLQIVDPEGEEIEMEVLEFLSLARGDYVVCAPVEGPADEAYAFRIVEGDEETYLEDVVDEDEWQEVVEAWQELIEEAT